MRNFVFDGILHANLYTFCADYGLNVLVLKELLGKFKGDLEKAIEEYKKVHLKDGNLHLQDLKLLNISIDVTSSVDEKPVSVSNVVPSVPTSVSQKGLVGSVSARDHKLSYKGTTYPTLTRFCQDKGYNYNSFVSIYYKYNDLEVAERHFLNPEKFAVKKKNIELVRVDNMVESLALLYNGVGYGSSESFCQDKGYNVAEFGVLFDAVKSLEKAEKLYLKNKKSKNVKTGNLFKENKTGEGDKVLDISRLAVEGVKYRSVMQFCKLNNYEENLMYTLVKKYDTLEKARKVYCLIKTKRVSRKQALQGLETNFINDSFEVIRFIDEEDQRGGLELVKPEDKPAEAPKKRGRKPLRGVTTSKKVKSTKVSKSTKTTRVVEGKVAEGSTDTKHVEVSSLESQSKETKPISAAGVIETSLSSSSSEQKKKLEGVSVFPMYKGKFYNSRSELCASVGISKNLVDEVAERYNIPDDMWMTLFHSLDRVFSNLTIKRPSFVESLPVIIINETWYYSERSVLEYLGLPKQVYDLTDSTLSMAERLASLEGMEVPVETSRYDHDTFSWGCKYTFVDTVVSISTSLKGFGLSLGKSE